MTTRNRRSRRHLLPTLLHQRPRLHGVGIGSILAHAATSNA